MTATLPAGFKLGSYEIAGEIGQGPTATVYRAYQPRLDRHVALKVVNAPDAEFRQRFQEVARRLGRLRHANIAQVYDFGEQDGLLYVARELVTGDSLRRRIGSLKAGEVVAIAGQVAAALDYAHASGVLHGDLRPSNVLLADAGRVFVVDFGVGDAAPREGRHDDIRALGVLSRQMLTGSLEASQPDALAPEVAAVLDREDYATALAFSNALGDALIPEEPLATVGFREEAQPGVPPEPRRATSRWPVVVGVTAVVALSAGLIAGRAFNSPAASGANATITPAVVSAATVTIVPATTAGAAAATAPASPQAGASAPVSSAPASTTSPLVAAISAQAATAPAGPTASPTLVDNNKPPVFMAISNDGLNFGAAQTLPVAGIFLNAFTLSDARTRVYLTEAQGGQLRAFDTGDFQTWNEAPISAPQKFLLGDLVRPADGGYRLYYVPLSEPASGPRAVHSARSTDGLTFADEPGVRYSTPGLSLATVARNGASWLMVIAATQNGVLDTHALSSTDGLTFADFNGARVPEGSGAPKISAVDGKLRLLFPAIAAVTSWSSGDGKTWQVDPGVRQRIDPGKLTLQPAILKTGDGVYRLFYTLVNRAATPTAVPR